jgi:glycogen debranching enzyme
MDSSDGSSLSLRAPASHEITVAESLAERRARTLKHGDSFAVLHPDGDVRSGSADGIYHADTRHLSRLDLRVNGRRPILLSSTVRDDNSALVVDVTNPEIELADGTRLDRETLHVRRTQFLFNGRALERLHIRNYGDRPVRLDLQIRFEADFADIFEVRGSRRLRHGRRLEDRVSEDSVRFSHEGLDGRIRQTVLRFAPLPARITSDHVEFLIELAVHESMNVFFEVIFTDADVDRRHPAETFLSSFRRVRAKLRREMADAATIQSSNANFDETIRRSVADLWMLGTDLPEGRYPYAGVPWFSTVFGRDALITAFQTLWFEPTIALGVLNHLAANQATTTDPFSDSEPGKILHEVRRGEMAESGEVPFRRYYGSVDSTPLFIMLAGAYFARTGDLDTAKSMWPHLEAAMNWIDQYGDRDGDGFIEYYRATREGLANQGWKDSHDSIFHADGQLATGPIALCEVQGYAYAARLAAATIAAATGRSGEARRLRASADQLRSRFEHAFWSDEIGTYALALDGDKRPCRVRTSNAGHALWTGIARPQRAAAVASYLMSSNSYSGWGVRTVAIGEPRYNPISYHNGSVWPHDNALIGSGLARYGYKCEAARILESLFSASMYIELHRLPELFCGFSRVRGQGPTVYPVACSPQAWAAATPISLLQSVLGIEFDAIRRCVVLRDPLFPDFLDTITLRNIRLGGSSIDIQVDRVGSSVAARVLRRSGPIQLQVIV